MAPKRSRNGLKIPYSLSGELVMSAANTYTEEAIDFNTNAVGQATSRVVELYSLVYTPPNIGIGDVAPGTTENVNWQMSLHFGTRTAINGMDNPFTIWYDIRQFALESPAATDFFVFPGAHGTVVVDFTKMTGTGSGIMVAPNSINIGLVTGGHAAAGFIDYRLFYDIKTASLTDYLKLNQSQQPTN